VVALTPVAFLLLGAVGVLRAEAAPPEGSLTAESPTRGIEVPTRQLAGDPEAANLETNAAQLSFLQNQHLQLLHVDLEEGARGGAGDALFLAQGSSRWGFRFGSGLGLSYLRPPKAFDFDRDPTTGEHSVKLIYGFSAGHGPVGFGFGGEHFFASSDKRLDGFDTFSLSVALRPSRFVSMGIAVHDLFGQRANYVEVGQNFEAEVALRPLGRSSLELAGAIRYDGRTDTYDPRGRISLSPFPGVVLRAAAEVVRRVFEFDAVLLPVIVPVAGKTTDVRLTAGVEIDLENFGVGMAGFASTSKAAGRSLGYAAMLRWSSERYPAVRVAHGVALRITPLPPKDQAETIALLLRLRAIITDPRVSAVVLDLSRFDGPIATMEELRAIVGELHRAGKRTLAFLGNSGTRLYHLASACSAVVIDPAADLDLVGAEAQQVFFKALLDRVGVRADFLQVGEFKSAPAMLMREQSSEPARQMTTELVASLNDILASTIAADRKLLPARAVELLRGGPYSARAALAAGLVDSVARRDELAAPLSKLLEGEVRIEDEPLPPRRPTSFTLPHIAVVLVEGNILDEEPELGRIAGSNTADSHTLVSTLDELARDRRVRGVVLRVSSPGGAVLASDRIARAVERLAAKKPLVASFAEVAASGGYYVAAPAQTIYSLRSTVCGSIGIFGGKIEISKLLDLLGINVETYGGSPRALLGSPFFPYSEDARKALMLVLEEHYRQFIDVVARGRHLSTARVQELARGRVYTGIQALPLGLVDRIGGLGDALADVTKRTGLPADEIEVVVEPEPRNVRELKQLLADEAFGRSGLSAVVPASLRGVFLHLAQLGLGGGNRVWARMPYDLVIR
jgi:protease-4